MAYQQDPALSSPDTTQSDNPVVPARIPLFPLRGALLLPGGDLPLNIFEPRYLAMMDWAMRTDRMIGMIQPRTASAQLYDVGCVGRITQYNETPDGRILISLRGVTRFRLQNAPRLTTESFYLGEIDCAGYLADRKPEPEPPHHLCRAQTRDLLERFLARENLSIDWEQAASVPDARLYTLLAMVMPLQAAEKQALLEAADCTTRYEMLLQILEIALAASNVPDDDAPDGTDKPSVVH